MDDMSYLGDRLDRVRQNLIWCERDMRRFRGNKDLKIYYRSLKAEEKGILNTLGCEDKIAEDKLRQREMRLR